MMQGHESTIHSISMHASGRYAMTTCTKMAQLWDLDSFQRKRKLTVKEEVPIVKVGLIFRIGVFDGVFRFVQFDVRFSD